MGCTVCGGGRRDPRSTAEAYICRACRRDARESREALRVKRPAGRSDLAACDRCGREARRKPTKNGRPYRCLECRRIEPAPWGSGASHGTPTRYGRGCRCDECRTAAVAAVRDWQNRYRDIHGVLPSTAYRKKHGYGPVYWIPEAVRAAVYRRDSYACQICGAPTDPDALPNSDFFPSLDHITPRSKGGTHDPDNLRTAHRVCNARRGNRD